MALATLLDLAGSRRLNKHQMSSRVPQTHVPYIGGLLQKTESKRCGQLSVHQGLASHRWASMQIDHRACAMESWCEVSSSRANFEFETKTPLIHSRERRSYDRPKRKVRYLMDSTGIFRELVNPIVARSVQLSALALGSLTWSL